MLHTQVTHMKSCKHLQRRQAGGGGQKKKKKEKKGEEHKQKAVVACEFPCACAETLACMRGMQIKTAASVMTVCAAVTCGFPGGPPGPL